YAALDFGADSRQTAARGSLFVARPVGAERERDAQAVADRQLAVVAHVDAVEVRSELRVEPGQLAAKVVAAGGEDADSLVVPNGPAGAYLIVPVAERHAGAEQRQRRRRVAVAPTHDRIPAPGGERRFNQRARVERADNRFGARLLRRTCRLGGDDA